MSQLRQAVEQVFVGNSEMARLMRARFACAEGNADWSQTPLGSVETWSQSLRTSISICLSSPSPILLWWGTDFVMFYNDACRPLLGAKHPTSMGQPGRDVWIEEWDVIKATLQGVLLTGEATWSENQQLLLDRSGYLEECYFTFSYSPIADETGGTGGVFTAVTETTRQVIGERRLQTLRDLAADTAKAKTPEETYRAAIAALAGNPNCIPFALLYQIESDEQAHLVGATGLEAGTAASPSAVKLSQAQAWTFEQVQTTGQPQRVEDLRTRFGQLFDKDGTTIANDAVILPLTQVGGKQRVIGFLVLGISPKLAFDLDYQSFFDLVARSVETRITNAYSYEAERQRTEALTECDRTETTLSSRVNHEFRAFQLEAERAEQKAETLLSSISDGVYTFDRDWRYTYVNDRLCQMAGKSREELLGHCIWEVFPEAVDTDVYVHFHNAMREQLPLQFEVLYSPWNRWFEHRLYPAPDGLTIFSAEVTARKQAELVLVEQKRLLELIALGHSLDECLSALCNAVSRLNPRAHACILLADTHRLTFPRSITPDFPPSFGQGLKDAPINELCIGTCGEAVYSGQPVTCADITNDDRWSQEWRDLCVAHGILACHSVPVLDGENQPLGSLMLCFDEPRMPTDWEYQIATFGTQIVSIVFERDRANAVLQQREEQLRLAVEAAHLGLWHWDVQSDTLTWTDQCKALFGLPAHTEMSYDVFLNAIHPDDRQRVQDMRPVLEDGQLERHEIEYRTLWSDGTVRWLMARGNATYDTDGKTIFSMGVIFDITERKRAENAIREGEERLKLAMEAGRMVAWEWNPFDDRLITSANFSEIYGANGIQTAERGITLLHPEDRSRHQATVTHAVETRSGYRSEFRIIRADTGAIVWLEERGQPILNEDGSLQKLIGVAIDISDHKQAEMALHLKSAELRHVTEMAGIGLTRCSRDLRYLSANPAYAHLTGMTIEEIAGRPIVEVMGELAFEVICPYVDRVLKGERVEYEAQVPFAAGGMRDLYVVYTPDEDSSGNIIGWIASVIDISDRKQAEAALRESEERFRVLADCAPSLIWLNGVDGGCEFVNQAYLDFFGKTLEEIQGFGWQVDLHPDDAEEYVSAYLKAFRERKPFQAKVRVRRADGQYRWLDCYATPRLSNSGDLLGYVGTSFDITDRRQTEDALRESEERLRLAMEAAQMGSWDLDIKTGKLLWSEQYFKVLGYEPDETGAASYELWSSRVHPDDRELVLQRWQQSRLEQQLYQAEYRVIRADNGQIAWVASLGSFTYDETGQPIRALGVVFDITDRKQKDAALQESLAILNTVNEVTPTLIYIKDRQRRLQMINPATARLLGKSEAELIGKTEVDYLRPEQAKQIAENDCRVMESGQVIIFEELVVVPEGNRIFLSAKAPYRDEQGNIIGLIGVSTDITERKQAEVEREQLLAREHAAREEAERANRIKDEFLAMLSHELRSPLNPILGWSRLLLNGNLDETRTRQALTTIERNAKLQSELIEDLLDVSRILQGKLSLTISPVNLASVIKAAIETVRLAAESKSIAIETNLDSNIELVSGDATRLQQVVWNLLSNAVKFTPEGGHVTVRLEQVDRQARITVSDTGKGIVPDFLPYVFDYFRQADSATTRKFGGLGLGLAIVRHLVELHGSTIQADSPGEGLGATFTVNLPLMQTPPKIENVSQPHQQSLTLQGIQVLIVDDDTDTRDFIEFLLQQSGAMVTTSASAKEALTALAQFQPDVLLSDIGMPDMDGYMLMQRVRVLPAEQGGKTPAIALTAYAGEYDQQQALSVGFQRHLSKPVEPEKLVEVIVSLLNRAD